MVVAVLSDPFLMDTTPARMTKPADTLRPWLKDWARWMENTSGYSDSTTLWRAYWGRTDSPPTSSPPLGALPPPHLEQLVYALNTLSDNPAFSACVGVVKTFYRHGPKAVMDEFNLRESGVYKAREQGETAIRAFLVATMKEDAA